MPLFSASYFPLTIIALFIECSVIATAWRQRRRQGAIPLMGIALAQLIWIAAHLLEWYHPPIVPPIVWGMTQFVAQTIATTFALVFVVEFVRPQGKLRPIKWLLLMLEPLITIGLTLTAQHHQLLMRQGWSAVNQTFATAVWRFAGPWLLVDLVYDYGLRFVALSLLAQVGNLANRTQRQQFWLISSGVSLPVVYEVILFLNGNVGVNSPLTVPTWAIGTALFGLAFMYSQEQDIVPVADRAVIQGLSDGVIVLSTDNRVIDLNLAAARMLNQKSADIIGKPAPEVIFPTHDLAVLTPSVEAGQFEISIPDGENSLTYDLRISPLHDVQGRITGRAVVMRDMTGRAALEAALTQAKENAEAANRAKGEFLSIIGHELRTPLSVILLKCGIMERLYANTLAADLKGHLRTIEENGRRLALLLDDMLDIARIEDNRPLELSFTDVPIASVLQEGLKLVSPKAKTKEIAITVRQDNAMDTIHGDVSKLRKIVRHLLDNAVKFTPQGGTVGLDIAHDVAQQNGHNHVAISVWDTGIGLEASEITRLFQPFTQLNGGLARPYEGTGIGLTLVKHITDLHGGTIDVQSNRGEGSRFTVSLPHT